MGLEGNFWKKKSIDGDWIKRNEAKDRMYGDKKDSYDYLMDDDSIYEEFLKTGGIPLVGIFAKELEEIDEDDKASYEDSKSRDQEIDDMIAASNYRISELWDSSDLGKYTINTPTIDKQKEDLSAKDMEIFDENEFEESLNAFNKTVKDGDPIKEETNAEIKRIMQQMELEW